MIKYLLFLLPSFTLFDFFFQNGVTVSDNFPATIGPAETRVIEFQIDKGTNVGFAKLQLDIPFGFTAKAVETKGASFTFSGQIAKFIWMTLPSETAFKIKMELTAGPMVSGSHAFKGQFSYIENNQRVDYDLLPKTVVVGAKTDQLASTDSSQSNSPGASASNAASAGVAVPQTEINDNCFREMVSLGGGKYLVKVTVKDLTVKGYAKLEEKLTANTTIVVKKSLGAVVTTDKDFVKFVWFDAPQSGEFTVEYEISSPDAPLFISGKFSYVKSNAPTEMAVGSTPSYVKAIGDINAPMDVVAVNGDTTPKEPIAAKSEMSLADTVAEAKKKQEATAEAKKQQEATAEAKKQQEAAEAKKQQEATAEAKKQKDAAAEAKKQQEATAEAKKQKEAEAKNQQEATAAAKKQQSEEAKKQQEATADNKKDSSQAISKVPEPEVGISYKVQIVAAHRTVGKEYFIARHKFHESFGIENHEGWVKYTTGKFGVYADARNAREEIKSKYDFDGPFVTAYNQGERITVQEALMISNQQWLK